MVIDPSVKYSLPVLDGVEAERQRSYYGFHRLAVGQGMIETNPHNYRNIRSALWNYQKRNPGTQFKTAQHKDGLHIVRVK